MQKNQICKFKKAIVVDILKSARKVDLANLNAEVDQSYISKLQIIQLI